MLPKFIRESRLLIDSHDMIAVTEAAIHAAIYMDPAAKAFQMRFNQLILARNLTPASPELLHDHQQAVAALTMSLLSDVSTFLSARCREGMAFGERVGFPGQWGWWSKDSICPE